MDPKSWVMIENYSMVTKVGVGVSFGPLFANLGISLLLIVLYSAIAYCNNLFTAMSFTKLIEASNDMSKNKKDKLKSIIDYGDKVYIGMKFGKVLILLLSFFLFLKALVEPLSIIFSTPFLNNLLLRGFVIGLITFIFSIFLIIFGEYLPRIMVENRKKDLPGITISVFYFFMMIFKPATSVIYFISKGIVKIFKVERSKIEPEVTEEDLLMMVGQGTKKGVFETSEHDMITNIFEFDDVLVEDIMTHRTELSAIESTNSVLDLIKITKTSGYSRIPVFDEDLDDIIGVIYAKDLLDLVGKELGENADLKGYIRPAVHVPETNTAKDVFIEMTAKKVQLAIVVDEYGGTSGIVTMEDLLEFIVGSIEDEYDDEEDHDQIEHTGNNEYLASGQINITKLSEILAVELPLDEDYETLSGFLTTKLGFIPDPEDRDVFVIIKNIKFIILENDNRKINKVRIQKLTDEMLETEKERENRYKDDSETENDSKNIIED